jgi:hypothetical protein
MRSPARDHGVDRPIGEVTCENSTRAETRYCAQELTCFTAALSLKLPLCPLTLPGCISVNTYYAIVFTEEAVSIRRV